MFSALILGAILTASIAELPKTEAKAIALVSEDLDWPMRVSVNGLPLGWTDHKTYPKDFKGKSYILIPNFLLNKGKNTLSVTWKKNEEIDLQYYKGNTIQLMELESVEPQKLGKVLGSVKRTPDDVKAKKKLDDEISFEVTGDFPKWAWTTSKVITNDAATQKKLIGAIKALTKGWSGGARSLSAAEKDLTDQETSAKRAGLKRDPQIAALRKLIQSKKIGVEFRDDASRLQLLAQGRMARLVFHYGEGEPEWDDIHVFPIAFKGGAHDAPPGQMGPVDIMVDVWFRLDGDKFVAACVFGIWQDLDGL